MNKPALRRLYKQKRAALTLAEKAKGEQRMLQQLQSFHWPPVQHLFTFIPFTQTAEPDSLAVAGYFRNKNRLCRMAAPVIQPGNTLQAVWINEQTVYQANAMGIPEPANGTPVPPDTFDLVIVPLLAFDTRGHRLGYGKGYYDRYLAQCRPGALRVGLSFFEPEPPFADTNEFDVPLTHCITPAQVYVF